MIGRLVRSNWHCTRGVVIKREPLSACENDLIVREESGRELQPDDGWGPLPSRQEAQAQARAQAASDLEAIRAKMIAEWARPWPGAEFGKTIIGRAIDSALADVKGKL